MTRAILLIASLSEVGEYHQGTAHPDALKNNAQQLQPGERQQSGGDTEPVHA